MRGAMGARAQEWRGNGATAAPLTTKGDRMVDLAPLRRELESVLRSVRGALAAIETATAEQTADHVDAPQAHTVSLRGTRAPVGDDSTDDAGREAAARDAAERDAAAKKSAEMAPAGAQATAEKTASGSTGEAKPKAGK